MTLVDRIRAIDAEDGIKTVIDCVNLRDSALIKNRMVHFCIFPETELWELERFIRYVAALKFSHLIVEFWGMLKYDCLGELSWAHAYSKEQMRPIIELANEASLSFRQGAVRTEFVFEETTAEELSGEPSLLIQALENLFSNAVSHGKATLIRVAVRRENNSLVIDVCDNGSGIPEEHRSRIFERFYRGTAKRPENVPGNGLGLVIVKRIVSLHNGDIELAPRYGMWQTVFRITLPLSGK